MCTSPTPNTDAIIMRNRPGLFESADPDEWPYVVLLPDREPNGARSLECADNYVRLVWLTDEPGRRQVAYR